MRRVTRWTACVMSLLIGVTACQVAETPEQMQARMDQESAAVRQGLEAMASRFEGWVVMSQADSIAAVYTENATFMPPNQKAATGRDDIRTAWANMLGMGQWALDLQTASVVANGPLAVERGSYTLSFTPGPNTMPGMPPADTGKYLVHWHQVGDQWMIVDDIFNSDVPFPPPAPAGMRR